MYKKMAKKVLKKYKGGAIDQIVKDPELKAGGGAIHHPVKAQPEDLVKKKAEGGDVKKDREELRSEVKGMGPEGKTFLRDKLSDKKYEGKLKGKYKFDLNKEIEGLHKKGEEDLKRLVAKKAKAKPEKRSVKREGEKVHKARSVKREGEKPSLGKIIESKALKFKLREGEKIPKKDIVKKAHGGWMQSAVKKPGALRAVAKKDKLIKGDEKLSSSDLSKLGSKAKKSGNSLLAKRVSLAKTFAKMRKK